MPTNRSPKLPPRERGRDWPGSTDLWKFFCARRASHTTLLTWYYCPKSISRSPCALHLEPRGCCRPTTEPYCEKSVSESAATSWPPRRGRVSNRWCLRPRGGAARLPRFSLRWSRHERSNMRTCLVATGRDGSDPRGEPSCLRRCAAHGPQTQSRVARRRPSGSSGDR
jgi:hypothetical protein